MKINNYYVGRKVRDLTNYQAPNFEMVDNVNPVLVINPNNAGAEVQPSLPKPNANQDVLVYYSFLSNQNNETNAQVATPDAVYDYYFLGVVVNGDAAGCSFAVGDQTSAAISQTNANTTTWFDQALNAKSVVFFSPLPIKVTAGIRIGNRTPAAGTTFGTVYYLRERKFVTTT